MPRSPRIMLLLVILLSMAFSPWPHVCCCTDGHAVHQENLAEGKVRVSNAACCKHLYCSQCVNLTVGADYQLFRFSAPVPVNWVAATDFYLSAAIEEDDPPPRI